MNQQQLESLNGFQKKAVYEKRETIIDQLTGQILRTNTETITKSDSEPDFIKLYYSTMLTFNGVNDVPLDLLLVISSLVSWSNDDKQQMIFRNDKYTKAYISHKLNVKESMVTKYIKRCCHSGLLIPVPNYRGLYYVNPCFIAKGRWEHIKNLRSSFNFIDGTWNVNIESEPKGNPENEKSSNHTNAAI